MEPSKLGRYEIRRELGRGGMAVVYLAHDPRFERDVALKVLPQQFANDSMFRERFNREARVIAALEHFAIVPVYDYGTDQALSYFVMRFMSGGSLAERVRGGTLQPHQILEILDRIASALDQAHQQGIVHRDLKPANILFDQHEKAYLSDFGIVRLMEDTANLTGTGFIGTAAYTSPEQIQGAAGVDGRSDVYTLGIILYEMLTGRQPYRGETPTKQMMAHVLEPVPDISRERPDLPERVRAAVSRALAKDPADRFQTAGEMAAAVRAGFGAAAGSGATVPAPAPERPARKRRSLLPFLLAGVTGLVAVTLIGIALFFLLLNNNGDAAADATAAPTATAFVAVSTQPAVDAPTGTATAAATATDDAAAAPPEATSTPQPSPTSQASPTLIPPTATSEAAVELISDGNLRTGPGTNFDLVAENPTLRTGTVVQLLGRSRDGFWYNVVLADDTRGWIFVDLVRLITPPSAEDVPPVVTEPATPIPPPPTSTPVPPTSTPVPPTWTPAPPTNTPPPPATPTPPPPPTSTPWPTATPGQPVTD